MPESNKGANARRLKANRAAGVGDETGRLPSRVKNEAIMICCEICKSELKVTKTNTELKLHAEGKHGKTLEECFIGAAKHSTEINARLEAGKKGVGGKGGGGGLTKAEQKKKNADGAFDMLSAGLSSGKKGKKK